MERLLGVAAVRRFLAADTDVPFLETLLIARPAWSQMKTPYGGCVSDRISGSLPNYTPPSDLTIESGPICTRRCLWSRPMCTG